MRKRHLLLPCLLLLSALVLVACGGSSGSSAEAEIEAAIETSATKPDPANCTKFATQKFLEQSTSKSGKAALKNCEEEEESGENKAESVTVTNVEVEGSKATADAAVTGGGFEGQTLEIALVEEEGAWKLDQLTGFAKFDQKTLVKTFEAKLEEAGELNGKQVSCIVAGLEEAPEAELEELVISGNSAPIEELAEGCA